MAVVLGVSSGFVITAPTADPAGTNVTIDGSSVVTKDTSPVGAVLITEIGWYRGAGTNAANFEIALYSESAGVAATRLQVDATNSSVVQGWVITAVSWAITESTAYWLAVQMDAHTGSSSIDSAASGGVGSDVLTSQTTLANPYGGGAVADADGMYAIYAKVNIQRDLSIPVGTVVIAGVAPAVTVSDNKNFTIPTGVIVIDGVAPAVAVTNNQNFNIGVGEIVIEGIAPAVSVTNNINLDIPVGNVSIEGIAPAVAVTDNKNFDIPAGEVLIEGIAPTVQTPVNVQPQSGEIVIEGVAPTISISDNQNFSIGIGDVSIEGIAPSVSVTDNINLNIPVGDVVINGIAPTLSISDHQNFNIGVGEVIIDGVAPSVTTSNNQNLNIPEGIIIIEGIAPTVSVSSHINLDIPTGEVIINGIAPSVGSNINLQIGAGEISIEGIAPTVSVSDNINLSIGVGEINIEGIAPSVQTPVNLNIPSGTIIINGIAPTFSNGTEVIIVDSTLWIKFGKFSIMPCDPCAPKFIVSCLTDEPTDNFEFNIYGLANGVYYWRITESSTILTKAFNHVEGTPLSISVADVPDGFFTTKRTFLFEILKTASSENPIPFLIGQYVEQLSIDIECNIYPSNTVGEDTTP